MRLLLIIGLVFASIVMVAPVSVQAAGTAADCHAMDMGMDGAGDEQDSQQGPHDKRSLHSCPGCAFVFGADRPVRAKQVPAIPRQESALTQHPSSIAAPVPPPPKP